jgi:hypothetical protein
VNSNTIARPLSLLIVWPQFLGSSERWNTLDGRWDWLHRKLTEKYRLTTPLERLFVSPRIRIEILYVFQELVRTQTHARVPRKAHPLYPYLTI